MSHLRRAVTWFRSLAEKAQWMDAAASLDARDPVVAQLARILVIGASDPRERAQRLHRFVRDRVWYSRDPHGIEMTPDARYILETGTEDCDGKARLLVALVRALRDPRLDARLRSVWKGGAFTHAQAEIRCGNGPWTLAELIVRGVELGAAPDDAPEVI